MNFFVSGHSGFVGKSLTKTLCNSLGRERVKTSELRLSSYTPDIFEGVDCYIHLACHSANRPYDNLESCIQVNVIDALHAFNMALKGNVRNFLLVGSYFEYGLSFKRAGRVGPTGALFPIDSYPASKAMMSIAATQWAIQHQCKLMLSRLGQVYGENESMSRFWPSLCKAAVAGVDFKMTSGKQIKNFENVAVTCNKLYKSAEFITSRNEPCIYIENICSAKPQSLIQFARCEWKRLKATGRLVPGSIENYNNEIRRAAMKQERVKIYPC